MKRSLLLSSLAFLSSFSLIVAAPPPESGWESADKVFGSSGKDLPGDVHRYGWPRTDLHVRDVARANGRR